MMKLSRENNAIPEEVVAKKSSYSTDAIISKTFMANVSRSNIIHVLLEGAT